MEKYRDYTTDDFVMDPVFIAWVQRPTTETDLFWSGFLERNPTKRNDIKDAAFIVKSLKAVEENTPVNRLDLILENILEKKKKKNIRIGVSLLKYAAVFLVILGLAKVLYNIGTANQSFPISNLDKLEITEGRLILSDGSEYGLSDAESRIRQTAEGRVLLNNDTLQKTPTEKAGKDAGFNQVIIPFGKRTEITLADGTRIWLNSGSQLTYPSTFAKDTREVYLSGEAFFDVKEDKTKPFLVITKEVKIKVLGTRFNVSAYSEDNITQAVLVEGKINIGKNSLLARTENLNPGEKMTFDSKREMFSREEVDVNDYTSWINGYLVFRNEPTTEVLKKLERYYNKTVVVEKSLEGNTFSGKLDLKEDIAEVLDIIAFASGVKITVDHDTIKVNP